MFSEMLTAIRGKKAVRKAKKQIMERRKRELESKRIIAEGMSQLGIRLTIDDVRAVNEILAKRDSEENGDYVRRHTNILSQRIAQRSYGQYCRLSYQGSLSQSEFQLMVESTLERAFLA